MSTTSSLESQFVADARAAGAKALADSKASVVSFLTTLGGDAAATLPTFETDGEKLAVSFLPANLQAGVSALAGVAVATLEPDTVTLWKTAWGAVLNRIEAAIP